MKLVRVDQLGIDKRLYARIPYLPGDSALASDYLADMRLVEAYKDIRVVMRGQSDLVKTIFELSPPRAGR
jgi:hypothetical protein